MANVAETPIGRNGIINSVRRISGNVVPGWRMIHPEAQFIAGYIAALDGNGLAIVADENTVNILGLFNCHKTINFYVPVQAEEGVFTGEGSYIALTFAYIKENTVRVYDSTGTTLYTEDVDYTVNYTHGLITQIAAGDIGTTELVLIDYTYHDPNITGLDQTIGSGAASVIEGNGEIATLAYETNAAWTVNAIVRVSTNGIPTTTGSGRAFGFVTRQPTAGNPELQMQIRLE